MVANNPLSSTPAVSTSVPSGVVPTGVSGVTAVPIPIFWDATYANSDGTTGAYRVVVGTDGKGQWVIPHDLNGNQLFTVSNPGEVTVSSLPSLPSGSNAIGSVSISSLPNITIGSSLPTGANVIGHVDVDTLPSVTIGTDSAGLAKDTTLTNGNAKIQVTALPALPTGSNTIGTVDVGTMPSVVLGAGTSAIGTVQVTALPALPAGANVIGHVDVDTLPNVTIGTDSVGLAKDATLTGGNAKVQVTTLPALPAGTNQIGHVVVDTQPLPSSALVAANKATCSAADNNVAPTGGFKHISIKNLDATNELIVTIDELSTGTPTKPIYLEAGESFDDYISGSALHYSASAGSPVLKYVLR